MRISYSQVTTYQRCPHQYQLKYIDRIPIPERANLTLGNAVHAALKFLHAPNKATRPGVDEVIDEYCRAWGEAAAFPENEGANVFQQGIDMLQRYYQRELERQEARYTAHVERYFSIPFMEGHSITGRIDRVDVLDDGKIEVLDYKTGRSMPAQVEVDGDLQLAIYRLATSEVLYPDKEVLTSLYYLHHGIKLTARMLPEQLEAMKGQIAEAVAGIEKEQFTPKVDSSCDWCDYKKQCMVFRPLALEPEAQADIEALVREYAEIEAAYREVNAEAKRLDARCKELQANIMDWLEQAGTGFYEVDNLQVLMKTSPRTTFPTEPVREILEPLGLWEKICKVSVTKTAIDRLCKSSELSPIIRQRLLAAAEVIEKPVLKLTRLGEEEADEGEE